MGQEEPDPDQLVAQARSAHRQHDFRNAYRDLEQVRRQGGRLEADDLEALGDAAWWLGLTAETLSISEEVHRRFVAEGRLDRAALNALELGFVWSMRGDPSIGSGWISRARRLLVDQRPSTAHGLLAYYDGHAALEEHDLDTALVRAREMQELGATLAAPTLTCLGLFTEGLVRIRMGDVRDGFGLLDEAMLPVIADEVEPDWAGSVYCGIMAVCHQLADARRAREWTAATERWCERFDAAVMFLGICRAHRVQLLCTEGAWQAAEREALQVRTDLADINRAVVAEADYQLGEVHRLRGEPGPARQAYARARELGRDPQPGESLLCLMTDEPTQGWTSITTALAEAGPDPFQRARLLLAQVLIALACGQLGAADAASLELQRITDVYRTPGFRAWTDHARGAVHLAGGDAVEAVPSLQRACHGYQELGAPYDVAMTQLLLADANRLLGDDRTADGQLEAAHATLRRLGAAPGVRRTSGGAGRRPGGLTDREVEVLTRVAEGASNRTVATAMSISEKTVGRHLANIYTKLGVTSRTEAAAWAFEHGLGRSARR